jgi:hypothetical protein
MTDEEKEQMAELRAQVLALDEWKRKITEQQNQGAARSAPIGSALQGVLGPTAQLAIDRAARPTIEVNQLDLIGPVK